MADVLYPIKVVVQRTGLSAHVIRVWERRYRVVEPKRTATNRRAYAAEDIERLRLLGQLTQQGHPIGFLAGLPTSELEQMTPAGTKAPAMVSVLPSLDPSRLVAQGLEATAALDVERLGALLEEAETRLGLQGLLRQVVAPLAQALGEKWRLGELTAAHEHFASAVLRGVLGQAISRTSRAGQAPVVVVATPSGQIHEVGALMVGALAGNLGWRVVYLGADLPAAEIAGAARQHAARLVALSMVYPEDDLLLGGELERLRELLPVETGIIAGGRGAAAFTGTLQRIGATLLDDLDELGRYLDRVRRRESVMSR